MAKPLSREGGGGWGEDSLRKGKGEMERKGKRRELLRGKWKKTLRA